MKRTIHVVLAPGSTAPEAAVAALRGLSAALVDATTGGLRLDTAVDGPLTMNATRPDGSRIVGLVSADAPSDGENTRLREVLAAAGLGSWSYDVEQDIPLDYALTWPDGEASPGVRQVTLLARKPDLTTEQFMAHWHGVHGPLALEVHPLWRYDRNRIMAASTGAPAFEGIVGLHFRELEDVTDVMRLYGGDKRNIRRISEDVMSFIDMSTITVTVMQETVLRR